MPGRQEEKGPETEEEEKEQRLERMHSLAALQMDEIRQQQDETPLIGPLESPAALLPLFENATLPGFAEGVRNFLMPNFTGMRRVRGDGNCFYRAFLFSYLDNVVTGMNGKNDTVVTKSYVELQRFKGIIQESRTDLLSVGYSEVAFETFYDQLIDLLDRVSSMDNTDDLLREFAEDGESDYWVWYMRLLTACHIKMNAERFLPFLDDGATSVDDFCNKSVEPMKQECEHVQITALTEYLAVETHIAYLDGKACGVGEQLTVHKFQEKERIPDTMYYIIKIHLLYRPGHYDVLMVKE